ncbi:MAG: tyrosine-type recombinase/integrase [Candidatus Kapabacteria bacterium]|nr:tyrosine-type recombinase/integrase [Ignavibacteriota bacterium]MCW5883393.1 tyrosine-type recombinase/integrase [Candidatus Kapabacteria bacterium]
MFLSTKKQAISKHTYKNYVTLKNHLKNYEIYHKTKLMFSDIGLEFNDKFVNYCINHSQIKNNTIVSLLRLLKSFMNWTFERDYHSNKNHKKIRLKEDDVELVALTGSELMRLYNLDLTQNTTLSKIRDTFCLSCFTGARFSDIANLKMTDIANDTWNLRTQKTRDILTIPLNDYALEIINRYKDSGTDFKVVSNQLSNKYLKELCKLAEITGITKRTHYQGSEKIEIIKPKYEFISTHTARRTFVTLSLEKGMRPEIVMSITGHKEYKTMKRYIKITSSAKQNEMKNVWKKI